MKEYTLPIDNVIFAMLKITIVMNLKFILIAATLFGSIEAYGQDVFGSMAPQKKATSQNATQKISLPDKPNRTDQQGRKQGEWAKKYANGQYIYVATFVDDKPVGKVTRYAENGKKTSESTIANDGSAHVVYFHDNGKKASEGKYSPNKKRNGLWTYYSENGVRVADENYNNGKLDGLSRIYFEGGNIAEKITYKDDVPNGSWLQYLPNGKIRLEATYVDGNLHGIYKYWDDNGSLSVVGYYRNGVSVGDWNIYEANKKSFVMQYDNNGTLLNADELQQRMNKMLSEIESKRKDIVDPANYTNTPELYKP